MKVLLINSFFYNGGSTGRIIQELYNYINTNGDEAFIAYGLGRGERIIDKTHIYRFEHLVTKKLGGFQARLFGDHGFHNSLATSRLCKWITDIQPDIIHLHNLHGSYVNVGMLFSCLKKLNKPVVWTLHDCWPFTGYCAHYSYPYCGKWKTGCSNCEHLDKYPHTYFRDNSRNNYVWKRKIFNSLKNLTIVTPCEWLKKEVEQSFLKKYEVKVINNGIDLSVFKPTLSTFKLDHNIDKMLLAVALPWSDSKGLQYLIKIAKAIRGTCWKLVVVGKMEEKGLKQESNVVWVPHTNNVREMAEMYSEADVFINPTLEDTFPTVNIEAMACGTPVVTFDTGGSKEELAEETGAVVPKGDWKAMLENARRMEKKGMEAACIDRAKQMYNKSKSTEEYLSLYLSLASI